jgi:hypothetical protein
MNDFPQRLISEEQLGRAHLLFIRQLRRRACAPGGDPLGFVRGWRQTGDNKRKQES